MPTSTKPPLHSSADMCTAIACFELITTNAMKQELHSQRTQHISRHGLSTQIVSGRLCEEGGADHMHAKHVGRFVQQRGVRRGRDGQVGRHLPVGKVRSGHSPCSAAAGGQAPCSLCMCPGHAACKCLLPNAPHSPRRDACPVHCNGPLKKEPARRQAGFIRGISSDERQLADTSLLRARASTWVAGCTCRHVLAVREQVGHAL